MSEIIRRIKRNPVLNIFILTALGQFSHDYLAGAVDWDNFTVYIATLAMGVIARMFAVPTSEHEKLEDRHEVLKANYQGALEVLEGKGRP